MNEIFAFIACVTLLGLAIFQSLLIAGLPIGRFAWGGAHEVLPTRLRIASVFSIILYALFAAFILTKASLLQIVSNSTIVDIGMWVFTTYFCLGIFMNAISRSKYERLTMTPVVSILAIAFLFVTLS